jgi:hypothetical protein
VNVSNKSKSSFSIVGILTKSRSLANRKWTKGSYFTDGAVCMAGAIGLAVGHEGAYPHHTEGLTKGDLLASRKALTYLANAITLNARREGIVDENGEHGTWTKMVKTKATLEDLISHITSFNDDGPRTKKQVLKCFDTAIKNAQRGHVYGN